MTTRAFRRTAAAAAALALAIGSAGPAPAPAADKGRWVSLFDGKTLNGWTPKLKGSALGENFNNTFRVEDGVIKVSYDKYGTFHGEFGHLFYKSKFSRYRLRVEYRFVGDQVKGGPTWAFRNSGVMIHCQDPATMRRDQEFPVCLEVQFLGGPEKGDRPTGNLCTPGTNVVMDGKLVTTHCINSTSKTFRGDQWVTAEVECRGAGKVTHFINGTPVISYEQPQLDPADGDAKKLIEARGGEKLVSEGYLSLQAESHPVEFRKVEVMELED